MKSDLEKESILNSYKIFLKTCNFNFQIIIQSNKEDISKHINKVRNNLIHQKNSIQEISNKYINYIQNINNNQKASSKNFYIILKYFCVNKQIINFDDYAIEDLNDKYFKIKDCLSRCGNSVINIENKNQIILILFSFLNSRINFNNK